MLRPLHIVTLTLPLALIACEDGVRREYLYKPAYCLASGLASMSNEDCLPEALKEDTAAIAAAKVKSQLAPTPSPQMSVYYTADQRASMGYDIGNTLFAPSKKLITASTAMSLEANNLIEPASALSTKCGAAGARESTIAFTRDWVTPMSVNRETAKFLSEHYTDAQITELYRVAKMGGDLRDVKSDVFIVEDPKNPGKTIDTTPRSGTALGSILSYTTSLAASSAVTQHRTELEIAAQQFKLDHATRAQQKGEECGIKLPEEPKPAPAEEVKEETTK